MVNRRWVRRRNGREPGGSVGDGTRPTSRGCFDEKENASGSSRRNYYRAMERGDLFGWDVAISDTTGRAAVGTQPPRRTGSCLHRNDLLVEHHLGTGLDAISQGLRDGAVGSVT